MNDSIRMIQNQLQTNLEVSLVETILKIKLLSSGQYRKLSNKTAGSLF